MRKCCFCGQAIDDKMEIFRSLECPSCRLDLKICLNCIFYSPGSHWDCRETVPEQVKDKEKANFCDYFKFKEVKEGNNDIDKANKAREGFNKLFGDE